MQNQSKHIQDTNRDELRFKGIPSSQGIEFGKAIVLFKEGPSSYPIHISEESIPEELERFSAALVNAAEELQHIIDLAQKESAKISHILETYLLILMDSIMHDSIRSRIKEGYTAENAVIHEFDVQKQFFTLAKDPIIRERSIDFDHVTERLLNGLRNRTISHAVAEGSIVIGSSITPTDLMLFHKAGCLGFITEIGGIASHASILARSLSMPAIIGLKDISEKVQDEDSIIIDGFSGILIVHPTEATKSFYIQKKKEADDNKLALGLLANTECTTLDGYPIHLMANIDSIEDLHVAMKYGAKGIGLLRTEYLIIARQHFPTEQEQIEWYKELSHISFPHQLTIRAFDVGSDKFAEGLAEEDNPALGLRGIRFLLQRKDIFKNQIRAVYIASKEKNIRFMLPMISTTNELKISLAFIEECRLELEHEGIPHDMALPIGIMIETPASALIADSLAPLVSFFSIGTNDLTQYTMAADRLNEYVSDIYDPFNPAVIRLMKMAIESAKKYGIQIGICGELAGHSASTELLIGLGIQEISVSPPLLLELKKRILHINYREVSQLH